MLRLVVIFQFQIPNFYIKAEIHQNANNEKSIDPNSSLDPGRLVPKMLLYVHSEFLI